MHYLSVYALFKNEAEILREWIEHYIDEGVDHFYLIDNGSTDNYRDIIEPYMKYITLFHDEERGFGTQHKIYDRNILPVIGDSKWLMGIDLDEFVYTKSGTIASSLKNIKDASVGQILIPWKFFGSSGHIQQPSSVIRSFINRRKPPYNAYNKTICRSDAIERLDIHAIPLKPGFITVDPLLRPMEPNNIDVTDELLRDSVFEMNHYVIQSLDWFRRVKMTRGSSNFDSNHRNEEYFKEFDYKDVYDNELWAKKQRMDPTPILLVLMLLFFQVTS